LYYGALPLCLNENYLLYFSIDFFTVRQRNYSKI